MRPKVDITRYNSNVGSDFFNDFMRRKYLKDRHDLQQEMRIVSFKYPMSSCTAKSTVAYSVPTTTIMSTIHDRPSFFPVNKLDRRHVASKFGYKSIEPRNSYDYQIGQRLRLPNPDYEIYGHKDLMFRYDIGAAEDISRETVLMEDNNQFGEIIRYPVDKKLEERNRYTTENTSKHEEIDFREMVRYFDHVLVFDEYFLKAQRALAEGGKAIFHRPMYYQEAEKQIHRDYSKTRFETIRLQMAYRDGLKEDYDKNVRKFTKEIQQKGEPEWIKEKRQCYTRQIFKAPYAWVSDRNYISWIRSKS